MGQADTVADRRMHVLIDENILPRSRQSRYQAEVRGVPGGENQRRLLAQEISDRVLEHRMQIEVARKQPRTGCPRPPPSSGLHRRLDDGVVGREREVVVRAEVEQGTPAGLHEHPIPRGDPQRVGKPAEAPRHVRDPPSPGPPTAAHTSRTQRHPILLQRSRRSSLPLSADFPIAGACDLSLPWSRSIQVRSNARANITNAVIA